MDSPTRNSEMRRPRPPKTDEAPAISPFAARNAPQPSHHRQRAPKAAQGHGGIAGGYGGAVATPSSSSSALPGGFPAEQRHAQVGKRPRPADIVQDQSSASHAADTALASALAH